MSDCPAHERGPTERDFAQLAMTLDFFDTHQMDHLADHPPDLRRVVFDNRIIRPPQTERLYRALLRLDLMDDVSDP